MKNTHRKFIISSIISLPLPLVMLAVSNSVSLIGLSIFSAPLLLLFASTEAILFSRYSAYLHLGKHGVGYLLSFASFSIYILGTIASQPVLQLFSALLMFVGIQGSISGIGAVLLSCPALTLSLFPYMTAESTIFVTPLLVLTSSFLLYFAYRKPSHVQPDCQYCNTYRERADIYCPYCGKNLNQPPISIEKKKVIWVMTFTILFLLASLVNLQFYILSPNRVELQSFSLGKAYSMGPIPQFSANTSLVGNQKYGTFNIYEYQISYSSFLKLRAWLLFSGSQSTGQQVLLTYLGANKSGTLKSGASSFPLYLWSYSNSTLIGITSSYPVSVWNGTVVQKGLVCMIVGEDRQNFSEDNGAFLLTLINSMSSFASTLFVSNLLLDVYSFYLAPNLQIIESVAFVFIFLSVASVARSRDARNRMVFDNLLALNNKDFQFFAEVSPVRSGVGSILFERYRNVRSEVDWTGFYQLLLRLKVLGVFSQVVIINKGSPTLVWRASLP